MSEQLLRKICVLPDQVDINGQHQLRKAVSNADVGLGFQMKSCSTTRLMFILPN